MKLYEANPASERFAKSYNPTISTKKMDHKVQLRDDSLVSIGCLSWLGLYKHYSYI